MMNLASAQHTDAVLPTTELVRAGQSYSVTIHRNPGGVVIGVDADYLDPAEAKELAAAVSVAVKVTAS